MGMELHPFAILPISISIRKFIPNYRKLRHFEIWIDLLIIAVLYYALLQLITFQTLVMISLLSCFLTLTLLINGSMQLFLSVHECLYFQYSIHICVI